MIDKSTFDFLKALQKNNDRIWFEANRNKYEQAKENVLNFAGALITTFGKKDAGIGLLEPKQCMFRINRDVRFSKNKMPYKNNMSIYLNANGKKSDTAGYYIHIEPGKSFVAAGVWQPPAPILKNIRQEVDYNFTDFQKILKAKTFTKYFDGLQQNEKLTRPPKGYETDNPAIEFIKLKSFIASEGVEDNLLMGNSAVKDISNHFAAVQPLITFINYGLNDPDQ